MLLWCVAVQTGTRSWRGVLHCVVRWSRGKVPRAPRAGRRPNTFWRRIDFDSIPTPAHPLYIHPSLTGKYQPLPHPPKPPPPPAGADGPRPAARESPPRGITLMLHAKNAITTRYDVCDNRCFHLCFAQINTRVVTGPSRSLSLSLSIVWLNVQYAAGVA